jgi:hypothetical protein
MKSMPKAARDDKEEAADEEKAVSKMDALLAALLHLRRRYGIAKPVDFMVATLLNSAGITPPENPTPAALETCGLRGSAFCTLFLDLPNAVLCEFLNWLNTTFPDIAAHSLESIPAEEKREALTVISLNHDTDITLHIDTVIKQVIPFLIDTLMQDPEQQLRITHLNKVQAVIMVLQSQKAAGDAAALSPLITLLSELAEHICLYGFGKETAELNAQLQNINNAQDEALRMLAGAKKNWGLFKSIRKVLSGMITETLLGICKAAHVGILLNENTKSKWW